MFTEDGILDEYISLNTEVLEKTKRLEQIKKVLKTIGSFSTELHVCAVIDQSRTTIASLPEVESILGKQLLIENDLIKTTWFKIVRVSKK